MGGFNNPIIGAGGALVYPSIHSPNFSQGPPITGWSIDKNGNAFFSGTIGGTTYEINSLGAFFYSGTPALGNLIESIASNSGTDRFGNAFKPGFTAYGSGIFVEMAGAEVDFGSTAAATRITFAGRIYLRDATTDAGNPVTEVASPFTAVSSLVKRLSMQLRGESKDGTAPAQLVVAADGNAEPPPITGALGEFQGTLAAGRLDAAPAATAPPARPAGTEPWNAMTPLANGWANVGAPAPVAQYRLIPSPAASIEIIGSLLSAGSTAATIFTLPVAYRPAHTIRFPVELIVGSAPAAGTNMFGSVAATGAVGLFNIPTVAGDTVDFHALISLDA